MSLSSLSLKELLRLYDIMEEQKENHGVCSAFEWDYQLFGTKKTIAEEMKKQIHKEARMWAEARA